MRRSIILTSVLAVSTAVLGACDTPKPEPPKPPAASPTPAAAASPSPIASPTGSPAKPGSSPEVKKADDKAVNKDAKPATVETPKAK